MSKKFNYVYQITEKSTNKKYIGVRSCDIDPTEDLGVLYFSSSSDKQFMENQMLNPSDFVYSILSTHESRIDAVQMEINLHDQFDVSNNPDFFNTSKQTSTGWDSSGFTSVKDDCNKVLFVSVNDPRYLSGELKHVNTNMATVTDSIGNVKKVDTRYFNLKESDLVGVTKNKVVVMNSSNKCVQVDVDDPRYLSGELKHVNTNKVSCIDPVTSNTLQVDVNDPRYLSGELKHITIGKVVVRTTNGDTIQVDVNDPRIKSGELKYLTVGKMPAKNANGDILHVDVNDPRVISGELKHVASGKMTVRTTNGDTLQVDVNDPRVISGELKHVASGKVVVKTTNGDTLQVDVNDPRYLSGELKHMNVGMVVVKNASGATFKVRKDDPRYLSGELISLNSDRIKAKDFYGNVTMTTRSDPKYLSGELVSIYTKQIYSIDVDGFVKKVDITDDRLKSGEIKPISNQLVMCVDDNNNLIRMYKTDRDYINKKYKEVRRFVKVGKGKYAFADDIRFK